MIFLVSLLVMDWIALYQIQIMDSFSYGGSYPQRTTRSMDGVSQVSSNNYGFKNIDIPCTYHSDEQYSNYCTQSKCYQPLCSQCIQDHLILHKKNGYSDLGIKSMKGTRNNCILKLGKVIDELLKRLDQFEAPPAPQQQLQNLLIKLEAVKNELHQLIEAEFSRIRESLRIKLAQSTNLFKEMAEIHIKLQGIIEQLRETHVTLIDGGKRGGTAIPDCIRRTLSLDVESLLSTFQNQALTYGNRRKKTQFDVSFQKEIIRSCLAETVKIVAPHGLNASNISYSINKQAVRQKAPRFQQQELDSLLPQQIVSKGNVSFLHFFETGSNKLHLIEVENRNRGISRIVEINEFVVPAFHASLASLSGEYIFLSGGIVELDRGAKSPMFVRYSIRTGSTKKDFARVRARSSHSLCQDMNGDVYILGGYGSSEMSGGDTPFENTVQRVNQRNGKVQIQTPSNWGGSNLSALCKNFILKACDQGVQLYNPKIKQWIIADIINRPLSEYIFFKSAGYANLNEGQLLVFGGYDNESLSTDICFNWKVSIQSSKTARVIINRLNCKLPIAEGFDSCGAMTDDQGVFVLQNIEDSDGGCIENEKKLLRFDLKNRSGEWRQLQIINEQEE